jgi:hypothetical protein
MTKKVRLSFLFAFVSASVLSALSQASVPDLLRDQIYSALAGEWTGQLEYRDYQSDERVVLPAWLEIKPSADGRSTQFRYTYDDGPTKTVTELSTVAIDTAAHRFTVTSDSDHSSETYQVEGLDGLKIPGRGQFTLTGRGTENNKTVDVRITVTIDRNLYQFKKKTRLAGGEFTFRDGYVFTRRNPAR